MLAWENALQGPDWREEEKFGIDISKRLKHWKLKSFSMIHLCWAKLQSIPFIVQFSIYPPFINRNNEIGKWLQIKQKIWKKLWKLWQITITRTFNYQRTNLAESCKKTFSLRLLHCIVSCVSKKIKKILRLFLVIPVHIRF